MKKLTQLFVCSCTLLSMSGCVVRDTITDYITPTQNTVQEAPAAPVQRVYMDEVKGVLQDFTGTTLTMNSQEQTYVFDLSEATLECEDGMIAGDEISVIYEGQFSNDDTSTVKALKVVDDFHKKEQLEIHKAYGEVQSLTPNTITLKNEKGQTIIYPITGTEQYYQNGIRQGAWVYLYFKGEALSGPDGQQAALNVNLLKVLSVSDIDPLTLPEPTPTPEPSQEISSDMPQTQQLHATIQNISSNILTVSPSGSDSSLNIDLSQIPSYFKGGTAPGSYVTVFYQGQYQENSLEGMVITAVTGDDPDSFRSRNLTYTVSGAITGHTSNTVTLQTQDGATITCFTEDAANTSTSGFATGAGIRITFDPTKSRQSNIYTSIKIQDA